MLSTGVPQMKQRFCPFAIPLAFLLVLSRHDPARSRCGPLPVLSQIRLSEQISTRQGIQAKKKALDRKAQGLVGQRRSSYFFNFPRRSAVLSVRRTDADTTLIRLSLTVGIAIFASATVGNFGYGRTK